MKQLIVGIAAAAALSAQSFEVGFGGGVSRLNGKELGTLGVGDPTKLALKDGWRFGFRMAFNTWRWAGQESGYGYNRTQLHIPGTTEQAGMAIHQGFYNLLLYAAPEGSRIRPFVAGGGHFSNFVPPGSSAQFGGGSTKFGVNYGAGVKARLTDKFGIRFDVREYLQGKPFDLPNQTGKIRLMEVSAGFYLWM